MIGCFRISCSLAPSPRAVRSVALPAAKGTTILIGLSGKPCAKAALERQSGAADRAATPASAERRVKFSEKNPPGPAAPPLFWGRAGGGKGGGGRKTFF